MLSHQQMSNPIFRKVAMEPQLRTHSGNRNYFVQTFFAESKCHYSCRASLFVMDFSGFLGLITLVFSLEPEVQNQ